MRPGGRVGSSALSSSADSVTPLPQPREIDAGGFRPAAPLGWRLFRRREIREAKLWAAMGGVAVHDNEGAHPFRHYRDTAHLLAADAERLIAAAVELGMTRVNAQRWLQRESSTLHIDIFGSPRRRAIALCGAA